MSVVIDIKNQAFEQEEECTRCTRYVHSTALARYVQVSSDRLGDDDRHVHSIETWWNRVDSWPFSRAETWADVPGAFFD